MSSAIRYTALIFFLMTACGGPAAIFTPEATTDDGSTDPYVAFTEAVTAVEPLIDPGLEALTAEPSTADSQRLTSAEVPSPRVNPLDLKGAIAMITSPELLPLNELLYERFVQEGYGGIIDLKAANAGAAIQQFCQQPNLDLLTVSRPVTPQEQADCAAKGRQLLGLPIGRDALVVVVHPDAGFIRGVTPAKLAAILTGDTWSQVEPNWPEQTISRRLIGPDSAAVALLSQVVFEGNQVPILTAPETTFYDYPEPMVQALSLETYGIGILSYSTYQRFPQSLQAIPINGVSASLATVESGAYPFGQTLFLYADRQQLAVRSRQSGSTLSPPQAWITFYLTHVTEAASEVDLLPLTQTQLNTSKTQWMQVLDAPTITNPSGATPASDEVP